MSSNISDIPLASDMRNVQCTSAVMRDVWGHIVRLKWRIQDNGIHHTEMGTDVSDEVIDILTSRGYTVKKKNIEGVWNYRLTDDAPAPAPPPGVFVLQYEEDNVIGVFTTLDQAIAAADNSYDAEIVEYKENSTQLLSVYKKDGYAGDGTWHSV